LPLVLASCPEIVLDRHARVAREMNAMGSPHATSPSRATATQKPERPLTGKRLTISSSPNLMPSL
jgi:hypothetical protein